MESVRKALSKELRNIKRPTGIRKAIDELSYSADETGVLFIDGEDAITAWKLVEIARKYKGNLPDTLKM